MTAIAVAGAVTAGHKNLVSCTNTDRGKRDPDRVRA
jgi:hypothetical protein